MDNQWPDSLVLETYDFDNHVSYKLWINFMNHVDEITDSIAVTDSDLMDRFGIGGVISSYGRDKFSDSIEMELLRKYNAHYTSDGWRIRFATLEDKLEFLLTYS